jgi:hypothetical protein
MKKLVFLLVGVLMSTMTFSQDYYPFPDTNAIWNNESYWSPYKWINRYGIYGDTTIDSHNYKKIYKIENDSTLNINNMTYYAALRENESKKIFLKIPEFDFEFLIYDFSLSVGDTVNTNAPNGYLNWEPCIITAIDTIELENNQQRRRFKINDWGEYEYWIEGIGSIGGLFHPISDYILGTINKLLCFKHNDTSFYINNPNCDKCFCSLATSIEELNVWNSEIKIYPNPTSTILNISTVSEIGELEIKLFNSNGTLIESRLVRAFPAQIDVKNYPSGIYTLHLTNGQQEQFTRFIKIK